MSKKDIFGKNKNYLIKKLVIYTIIIVFFIEIFIPISNSCHTSFKSWSCEKSEIPKYPEESDEPHEPFKPELIEELEQTIKIKKIKSKSKSSVRPYIKNLIPLANASGPYYGIINEEIEFNGSKSYDLDGIITNYTWSFGDGITGFGKVVKHKYTYGRYFKVKLTVIDNLGGRNTNETEVFLNASNNPPSKPIIKGPIRSENTKCSYAFRSIDPDNDDIKYFIDWGDNSHDESESLPSGQNFSKLHSWDKSGIYTITVTASDNKSFSSSKIRVLIQGNIITDNISIIVLGILGLISLIIVLPYNNKEI
jgi:hypothetical protein